MPLFQKAVEQYPSSESAIIKLADMLYERKDQEKAEKWYRKIAEMGNSTYTMVKLADIYLEKKQGSVAESWHLKAAEKNDADAMLKLGTLLKNNKKLKKAKGWIDKANKINSSK